MMLLADKHIFIIEDNIQNRVVFQITLIRHGAKVDFERWGKNTLFRLRKAAQIDLIVLDLMLAEGISGFDLYDQIRALPEFDRVPILAVSALDAGIAIPRARSQGFAGFIAKPIDPYQFPQQLAGVMEGEQVWDFGGRTLA